MSNRYIELSMIVVLLSLVSILSPNFIEDRSMAIGYWSFSFFIALPTILFYNLISTRVLVKLRACNFLQDYNSNAYLLVHIFSIIFSIDIAYLAFCGLAPYIGKFRAGAVAFVWFRYALYYVFLWVFLTFFEKLDLIVLNYKK